MQDQQPSLFQFIRQQHAKLLEQTLVHLGLTFISLFIAMAVGISLGIFISRRKAWAGPILGVVTGRTSRYRKTQERRIQGRYRR